MSPQPAAARQGPRPLRTAHIPSRQLGTALVIALRVLMWGLVALSVMGSFYAITNQPAPLFAPWQMVDDAMAASGVFYTALAVQGGLMLAQWGGSELAHDDPRWWVLYFGALIASVWMNTDAYLSPLTGTGMPWLIAWLLIVGGDVAPEWLLKR
jgi:hypothetical protein